MKKVFIALLLLSWSLAIRAEQDGNSVETPARVYFEDGKLHFASKNDRFKLWLDNRIFVDAAYYTPCSDIDGLSSKANKDLETDDSHFRFSNGISIRHARLGFKSTVYDRWFAEFDIDFAYNEVELKDMYIGYKFNDKFCIKVGQFKEPMSMERLTSSKYLTMLERPMPIEAFASGRRLGGAFTGWGNHWWVAAGVFARNVDILQKEKNRGDDGIGVTARATYSPVNNEDINGVPPTAISRNGCRRDSRSSRQREETPRIKSRFISRKTRKCASTR